NGVRGHAAGEMGAGVHGGGGAGEQAMTTLDAFLASIMREADPSSTWLVLADWLEDQDDPRAELVRLMHQPEYRRDLSPEARDDRVRELLACGMQPLVPTITNSIGMKLALI